MIKTKFLFLVILISCITKISAQDDLTKMLDSAGTKPELNALTTFKALQVVNMQSTKMPAKHEFYLMINHRFGNMNTEGSSNFFDNFFGLDEALTKIGGVFGITDWLSAEVSRNTPKLYEIGTKYRVLKQSEEAPLTLVGRHTMNIDTNLKQSQYPGIRFSDKLAYTNQLLLSRKFSEKFSLELVGVWVHKNLIDPSVERKNLAVTALGGRYKLSNRVSVNAEYGFRLNPVNQVYDNPASLGVDIDTGGHVFQIVLSTTQKMNDVAYFSGTKTGVYLGFNLYRVF